MRGKQPLQQDYGDNMISDDDHVWYNFYYYPQLIEWAKINQ